MTNRRAEVALNEDEIRALLEKNRTIVLATIGPDGLPHLAPMWFLLADDGRISMWTYARSQKMRNLRRQPRATLLVEDGESYHELRGVTFDCDVEFVEDTEQIAQFGAALSRHYAGIASVDGAPGRAVPADIRTQAAKRIVLYFTPTRVRGWDHGKLRRSRAR